tara:strand:- start:1907 stop:2299 length:393 start_codon:yes stop_codon:yes gene_type:complete
MTTKTTKTRKTRKTRKNSGGSINLDEMNKSLFGIAESMVQKDNKTLNKLEKQKKAKKKTKTVKRRRTRNTGLIELRQEKELEKLSQEINILAAKQQQLQKQFGIIRTSVMINKNVLKKPKKLSMSELDMF